MWTTRANSWRAVAVVLSITLVCLLADQGQHAQAKKTNAKEKELEELRSLSREEPSGLIYSKSASQMDQFIDGKQRPYNLVISVSLTKSMLENEGMKTQKHAKAIEQSMKDAIKVYRKAVPQEEGDLFFILLEFNQETQPLFQKMEIQSFPTTVVIAKNNVISKKEPTFKIPHDMRFIKSSKKDFFEFLEDTFSMGVFDAKDAKISISVFNIVVGYSVLIVLGRLLWMFSQRGLLVPLMAIGSIVVFWVSTSGIIKCIIHNLPMVIQDSKGNPQVFVHDSRNQTISEGCLMSTCYLLIAACLSSFTFVFPYVKNEGIKNLGLYTAFVVGTLSYLFVLDCFEWKSHMRTRIYGWNL